MALVSIISPEAKEKLSLIVSWGNSDIKYKQLV